MDTKRKRPIRSSASRLYRTLADPDFEVVRLGLRHSLWRDIYHYLLVTSWARFLLLIGVFYVLINAVFALIYWLGGDSVAGLRAGAFPNRFLRDYFFSIETIATIGYGKLYPNTLYANIVASIEPLVGLLGFAMATGLMFAKFSRQKARVLFSNVAVIAPLRGKPTLMFRAANQRHNLVLSAQVDVVLLRNEITEEGVHLRRFYDLKLVRNRSPAFQLSWTVLHVLDETSPLQGLNENELADEDAEYQFAVTIIGTDNTSAQTIHARHVYTAEDILWNKRFADILLRLEDGRRAIDYRQFHDVKPL